MGAANAFSVGLLPSTRAWLNTKEGCSIGMGERFWAVMVCGPLPRSER